MTADEYLKAVRNSSQTVIASTFCSNVTPSDSADLANLALELFCTSAGTIVIVCADGTEVTLTVPANYYHPSPVKRVKATGTSPTTGIIAYH